MKNKLAIILLMITLIKGQSQNLVPNPSFEDYSACPTDQNQIHLAIGWSNYGDQTGFSTPDYFNVCSSTSWMSVPKNVGGYQQPSEGVAYAGIYTYESSIYYLNIRESIGSQLISPLIVGNKYYVSMKVSLAIDSNHILNQATNNLGILFSTVAYNLSNPTPTNNFAHIYSSTVITDTLNWVTISGTIVADSAYNYIVIGNFFDDDHTTIIQMQDTISDKSSYYYIDNVYVSTDSITNVAGNEYPYDEDLEILINSSSKVLTIEKNRPEFINYNLFIYDSNGRLINEYNIADTRFALSYINYKPGMYFFKFVFNDKQFNKKIIIN